MFTLSSAFKSAKTPKETPAQILKRVEAEIKAEEMRAAHAVRMTELAEIRATKTADVQKTLTAVKVEELEGLAKAKADQRAKTTGKIVNFTPLVLVNLFAIVGQFGELKLTLVQEFGEFLGTVAAVLSAGALESITLFVGYHAMLALRRKDSAAGLIFASIGLACLTAFLNYSHFTDDLAKPTAAATIFALFSFVSPFLWRIKIRSEHRDELAANGEIESRGVKLGKARWTLHLFKSFRVTRAAAWTGETDAERAISAWEDAEYAEVDSAHADAIIANLRMEIDRLRNERDAEDEPVIVERINRVPSPRPALNGSHSASHELVKAMRHPKWNEGVAIFEASLDGGEPMKQAQLARELGLTNRVLAGHIQSYVKNGRVSHAIAEGSDETASSTEAP